MQRRFILALMAAPILLAGCVPGEPVRFFALTPLDVPAAAGDSEVAIGVLPIALAAYLDRSGIVLRTRPNELAISSMHNWIEPLDTQARRVVARNLSQLLGTDSVFLLPEQRLMALDYVVEISVERFEIVTAVGLPATENGPVPSADEATSEAEEAILEARWTLLAGDERRVLRTEPARLAVMVEGPGTFERRVAAMSDALGRLSRAIATEIATRPS
jgi:uncharacterized lipoprotein YmbA